MRRRRKIASIAFADVDVDVDIDIHEKMSNHHPFFDSFAIVGVSVMMDDDIGDDGADIDIDGDGDVDIDGNDIDDVDVDVDVDDGASYGTSFNNASKKSFKSFTNIDDNNNNKDRNRYYEYYCQRRCSIGGGY